jgi:hypothetical protein
MPACGGKIAAPAILDLSSSCPATVARFSGIRISISATLEKFPCLFQNWMPSHLSKKPLEPLRSLKESLLLASDSYNSRASPECHRESQEHFLLLGSKAWREWDV